MFAPRAATLMAVLLFAFPPHPARAQIDYRNLDDDRPVKVEDAFPVERYAFEFLMPYAFERGRGGERHHALVPELAWGLLPNMHLGLKLPLAGADPAGGTPATWGISGLRAFALVNVNTESPTLPAMSIRLDGFAPVGALGGAGVRGAVKLIATRSFGRSRVHLNGAYGFGDFDRAAVAEGGERWWYGAALDHTLWRQSVLLVGATHARRASDAGPVEVSASVGFRWQWTPTAVVDAGLSRRLGARAGPDLALTLGFTHAFAVAALMPRGRPAATPDAGGGDAHRH